MASCCNQTSLAAFTAATELLQHTHGMRGTERLQMQAGKFLVSLADTVMQEVAVPVA